MSDKTKVVKTIREFLAGIKNVENIEDGYSGRLLDVQCTEAYFSCHCNSSKLQCYCGGGTVIMGFAPCPIINGCGSRAIYLIFNDRDGELWEVQRRDGKEVYEIGPKPSAKLTLVQSA